MSDVLPFLALIPAVLGFLWASIVVHEGGHYLLGLWAGVPARDLKIRLGRPSFVALRRGERWLSPDDPEYAPTFLRHNPSPIAAWSFVAGGFLLETGLVLLLVVILQGFGAVALLMLGVSSALFCFYLLADAIASKRSGVAYGDCGAMWRISAPATLIGLTALISLRVAALLHLL
ncbi:hypothetical protein [Ornithinimicrobium pratense]|uniref:M50 family metallopeptidase n=1 Tax=Ornithinimicrobium pratense TaxID=2593973 RepID=A0A5J6V8T1_9MICO|nr:hypothetical protein [Ornithinimicrobium pratense]QFG69576.1 hypothetical protein FY030_13475 [Ornithinimicrobium pratense]